MKRTFIDGYQDPTQDRFLTSDHLGSVTTVVDDTSALLGRYEYDPWGRRTLTAGSDLTSFGFTGHQWDEVAQVWMAQYRSYEPGIGRWTSQDPAGLVDGPNSYAYVRNAPTLLTDLKGLWAGGVGINLTAAAAVVWGGTIEGGAIAVSDSQGNVGLLLCGGGGIGNGLSISAGWQGAAVACPQCKSICDLEGPCFGLAGHFAKGPGIGVGGGVCVGSGGVAVTMSAGPVAGIGVFGGAMIGSCKLLWKRKECCP